MTLQELAKRLAKYPHSAAMHDPQASSPCEECPVHKLLHGASRIVDRLSDDVDFGRYTVILACPRDVDSACPRTVGHTAGRGGGLQNRSQCCAPRLLSRTAREIRGAFLQSGAQRLWTAS